MPELRVVVDKKLNKILDMIVEEWGLYTSKAELMRSATIYFLMQMGIIKELAKEKEQKSKIYKG